MFAFLFPPLNPVSISLGPVEVHWYALAYLAGFVLGWRYCLYLARKYPKGPPPQHFDDFLTWAVLGTVLGGRLGYIFIYQPDYYFAHPAQTLEIWHGGMSFHGGMLGVIGAALLFTARRHIAFFSFTDVLACVAPIGLGLGRLANFVNGELYGRETDVPWAVIFPRGGNVPRHPSQIYEALMEGLLLLTIMFLLSRRFQWRARPGFLSGSFLFFYGIFRFTAEFFREPDAQLGFLWWGATMGQLLCTPMIAIGIYLLFRTIEPRPTPLPETA
jgi:phosphatidylglycerol---prolipoprotein diacylglyceryl transferase